MVTKTCPHCSETAHSIGIHFAYDDWGHDLEGWECSECDQIFYIYLTEETNE